MQQGSHVPGESLCALAMLFDPGRTRGLRPFMTHGRGPRTKPGQGLAAIADFEAQLHGFGTRCLRLVTQVALRPRKTRFRLLASSTGQGFATCRIPAKGFSYVSSHTFLLSQALRDARFIPPGS